MTTRAAKLPALRPRKAVRPVWQRDARALDDDVRREVARAAALGQVLAGHQLRQEAAHERVARAVRVHQLLLGQRDHRELQHLRAAGRRASAVREQPGCEATSLSIRAGSAWSRRCDCACACAAPCERASAWGAHRHGKLYMSDSLCQVAMEGLHTHVGMTGLTRLGPGRPAVFSLHNSPCLPKQRVRAQAATLPLVAITVGSLPCVMTAVRARLPFSLGKRAICRARRAKVHAQLCTGVAQLGALSCDTCCAALLHMQPE